MQIYLLEPQLSPDKESENSIIKEVSQAWFHKISYTSPYFPYMLIIIW